MPHEIRAQLEASEARFRAIIECNVDAILIVRKDGVIYYANPAAESLLNRPLGQLVGQVLGVPFATRETTEIDLPHSDGATLIAEMRVADTMWQGETVYLVSLRDVTPRKRANDALQFLADASQALAGSLNYYETLSRVAGLAVLQLADWCAIDLLEADTIRRVAVIHRDQANALTSQLKDHWSPDWKTSSGLVRVFATGKAEIHNQIDAQAAASLVSNPEKLTLLQKLGCTSVMLVPLRARGCTLGVLVMGSARTNRYSEAELALGTELGERGGLAIDNARLYQEAQRAVHQRDEFLAMLAHELRNPLAAVLNAVEIMRRPELPTSALVSAEDVVERQGKHMARLLDDLLDISRVTRGKIHLHKRLMDLREVAAQSIEANRPLIESRRHNLTVSLSDDPIWVEADLTRMDQVVSNLLNNAAQYMDPGGNIHLAMTMQAGEAVLTVADSGSGIAPQDLPHIFGLFVQAQRSLDRAQGGLGIGLTLVERLVEMHGGTVQATSRGIGQGSEFVIRLPAARAPAVVTTHDSPPSAIQNCSIAIVEDSEDSREMLRMLLTLEGHQVAVAEDGRKGVQVITDCMPDVALIDIGLPIMDGYQVARALRSNRATRDVRLVALTGYGQPEDRQKALEAGFDEHLVKPVSFSELARLLPQPLVSR